MQRMSRLMHNRPTAAELQKILADLLEWQVFAIHLRGINEIEVEKIKKEFMKNASLEEQKLSLYSKWLSSCPDATWDDVVNALETINENRLAQKVKEEKIDNVMNKPKEKKIMFSFTEKDEEEMVEKLEELNDSFVKLFRDMRSAIEKFVEANDLQKIVENILDIQLQGLENLTNCTTVSELNQTIRKNCNFLEVSVLKAIIKYAINDGNGELMATITDHMEKVKALKSKAPLKLLKQKLKEEIEEDSAQTTLVVKLNNDWDKVTFNHVEELILALAGIHARVVRVNNGSVEITFMISRDKVMSFNITALKRQLMCLIGVLHLQVEDKVFTEDENMNYTFENGLLEAGKIGHIQATKFILNMNIVNINYQDNEGRTALMLASEHGHIEVLKLILSAGANVNIQDKHGRTAVMVAKTVEIYQTLVQANADTSIVTHKGSAPLIVSCLLGNHEVANHLLFTLKHEITTRPDGMTLLMAASQGGNQHIVEHLLTNGADPNAQNNNGATAIWLSCLCGHYKVIEILLKHNANLNIADNNGWTPLMVASEKKHYQLVELLLLQETINPNATNSKNRQTALMAASHNGHIETVKLLLSKGADPNIQDNAGTTAIWLSCFNGHYTVTETLLKHDADPNKSNKTGWTPLVAASQEGYREIAELLLVKGKVNPNDLNSKNGQTALMQASRNGHNETVELLLLNGADTKMQDKTGVTALWLACINGHHKATEILLKHKADPNVSDKNGWTPLMAASQEGHHEIVNLLLVEGKVNANAVNTKNGQTALMQASLNGHTKIVQLLLSNGANPNIHDNDHITAIWLSCFNGHYTVTETLLKHNADPNISDNNGWTPLMVTNKKGYYKIQQMLMKKVDPKTTDAIDRQTVVNDSQASQNVCTENVELPKSDKAGPSDKGFFKAVKRAASRKINIPFKEGKTRRTLDSQRNSSVSSVGSNISSITGSSVSSITESSISSIRSIISALATLESPPVSI